MQLFLITVVMIGHLYDVINVIMISVLFSLLNIYLQFFQKIRQQIHLSQFQFNFSFHTLTLSPI